MRAHAQEADAQDHRELPRLGPRLLVRARRGEHVQPPLRLAARRAALRLRPQVHVLAHRLQPEDDRHAGRGRRRPARQASGVHRRAAARTGSGSATAWPTSRSTSCCRWRRRGREPSWFGFPLTVRDGARSTASSSSPTSRSAGSRPGCSSAGTCCASRRTPASPAVWSATSRTPT